MALLLKNAIYIHPETLDFQNVNILVEYGLSGDILLLPIDFIPDGVSEILDCSGKFVTKSFVVGHHHVYSALARGMGAPKKSPENFYEILQYIWWTLDKVLDRDMIEASALATAIACAKAGSTFVIDHHASPNCITGSLDIIADAFDKVGINHLLCYEITDRDGIDKAELGLSETENYLKHRQGLVGLHASFTVGNHTLTKAVEMMQSADTGIHIHVAEDAFDQTHCESEYGQRVVERLHDFGVLNSPKTILGHCLHLSDNERNIISNSKAFVVQNTESNLNNRVGYFNGANLGNRILLGTDGMHSDMLQSAKAAFFVGQNFDNIDYVSAYKRFRMADTYLNRNNFVGNSDNNLVVLDYDSPTEFNQSNFLGHFIFGLNSTQIQHVISNGRIIVKNRILQTVNESEILKFTREQSLRLWEKMKA